MQYSKLNKTSYIAPRMETTIFRTENGYAVSASGMSINIGTGSL